MMQIPFPSTPILGSSSHVPVFPFRSHSFPSLSMSCFSQSSSQSHSPSHSQVQIQKSKQRRSRKGQSHVHIGIQKISELLLLTTIERSLRVKDVNEEVVNRLRIDNPGKSFLASTVQKRIYDATLILKEIGVLRKEKKKIIVIDGKILSDLFNLKIQLSKRKILLKQKILSLKKLETYKHILEKLSRSRCSLRSLAPQTKSIPFQNILSIEISSNFLMKNLNINTDRNNKQKEKQNQNNSMDNEQNAQYIFEQQQFDSFFYDWHQRQNNTNKNNHDCNNNGSRNKNETELSSIQNKFIIRNHGNVYSNMDMIMALTQRC